MQIPQQAFLDVASVNNPVLSYDADGIAGLGFTSLSTVDALVNQTGASSGRSLLYNAFVFNPTDPNYIAFALQSVSDPDDDVEGTFSIGTQAQLITTNVIIIVTQARLWTSMPVYLKLRLSLLFPSIPLEDGPFSSIASLSVTSRLLLAPTSPVRRPTRR